MANYTIARGTTWSITVPIVRVTGPAGKTTPVNLTGHRVVVTVRLALVDGTADLSAPPVWQGDNLGLGGVVLEDQSQNPGLCDVLMPASATQALPNPLPPKQGTLLYYDVVDGDQGSPEAVFQTEFGTILMTPRVGLGEP